MNKNIVTVSFIIPAKNEEYMLPGTVESIHNAIKSRIDYEIIVIDNGSKDKTASVAISKGARVIYQNHGTIGALRNTGVRHANGEYIVFLDADVSLADAWYEPFLKVLGLFDTNPDIITGSRCTAPKFVGWIADSWFWKASPSIHQITHVATGHMITTKALFNKLQGFDERLETGEDFDFCSRAKKTGAEVNLDVSLVAVHYGMPKSVTEFLRREIWHGAGDVTTIKSAFESKVVITSLVFLVAHVCLVISLVIEPVSYLLLAAALVIIVAICVASAWKKYRHAPWRIVFRCVMLFYIYYWGRTIAIFNRIFPFIKNHSPRAGRA